MIIVIIIPNICFYLVVFNPRDIYYLGYKFKLFKKRKKIIIAMTI